MSAVAARKAVSKAINPPSPPPSLSYRWAYWLVYTLLIALPLAVVGTCLTAIQPRSQPAPLAIAPLTIRALSALREEIAPLPPTQGPALSAWPLPDALAGVEVPAQALRVMLAEGLPVVAGPVVPLPEFAAAHGASTHPAIKRRPTGVNAAPRERNRNTTANRMFVLPELELESTAQGVRVASVGQTARAAGLRPGAFLLAVGGERVYVASQARALLRGRRGTTVHIRIRQSGQSLRLAVKR